MRIVRYSDPIEPGATEPPNRLGIVDGDHVVSIPQSTTLGLLSELDQRGVFGRTEEADPGLRRRLDSVRLLAPLYAPGKIVAIGLNYRDHASEAGVDPPTEPLVFAKFQSAITGPGDPIEWDGRLTTAVDYEAELGVVIGHTARRVSVEEAMSHIFAYTCVNDVSARDLQFSDGQWIRGKSLDSFCPIGPWLVTADEIPDPDNLNITCTVSGATMQEATTADMYFSMAELVSRLSHSFTLYPGDLIATGTPPGVGWFRTPRRLLRDGDEVIVEIEGIGRLRNPVHVVGSAVEV